MNYYISTFKKIKPHKINGYILKKRVNTIDILNNNKFFDTLNEDDIESEKKDLIPIRAIKIYNNEKKQKKKDYNNLKNFINNSKYNKKQKSNNIKLKTKDSDFFIEKYQKFLSKESNNIDNNNNNNNINFNNNDNNNNINFNNNNNSSLFNKTISKFINNNNNNNNNKFKIVTFNNNNNNFYKTINFSTLNSTTKDEDDSNFFHKSSHQIKQPKILKNFIEKSNSNSNSNINFNNNNNNNNNNIINYNNNTNNKKKLHNLIFKLDSKTYFPSRITKNNNNNNKNSLLLTSTNFSYSPKNKNNNNNNKKKNKKKFLLEINEQIILDEIKKEKKLKKLQNEINEYIEKNELKENEEENEIKNIIKNKKNFLLFDEDKFIRTNYNINNKIINKGKPKLIFDTKSIIKEYIKQPISNRPEIHKKKFLYFDKVIVDSEINNINKKNTILNNNNNINNNNINNKNNEIDDFDNNNNNNRKKKKKNDLIEFWYEKIENDIKNEIINYHYNLGEFIYDEKFQGAHQTTLEDIIYGERQFKEAVFESKRENNKTLDKTIQEKSLQRKKTFLEQAYNEMNLQKKNSRRIKVKYVNKY